jgi:type IV conjugative transfer system protein TraL
MDEVAVFVATLVIFLVINFFFTGLIVSGLLLAFLRGTRRGRPEGYILHLVYRVSGRRVGSLLPARVSRLSG